ncbi:hypothetical protein R3Q06_33665, partial [Rhodococcus erythropolis]|uniref:hypothetical protein n=1 Tax=Rhodococcus erythropolis TaxID=1833 RepID=UPI002948E442
ETGNPCTSTTPADHPRSGDLNNLTVPLTDRCNTPFVVGVLAGLAIAVHAANADQVYAAVAAIVVGVMLQVTLSPFFDWKGEFFADRFAAIQTSPEKVVALLTRFGTRWTWIPTPTHPSRARRVSRLLNDHADKFQ